MITLKEQFEQAFPRKFSYGEKSYSCETGFNFVRKVYSNNTYTFRYLHPTLKSANRIHRKDLLELKRQVVARGWEWDVNDRNLAIKTVKEQNIAFKDVF